MKFATDLSEFYQLADDIPDAGQGLVRFNVRMPEDYLLTTAAALNGDYDASMVIRAWAGLRQKVAELRRGDRIPCVCCSRSLKPRRFAFCLVLPMGITDPLQGMGFGICEKCASDRDAAHEAATRGIERVWPDMRELAVHPDAGHA